MKKFVFVMLAVMFVSSCKTDGDPTPPPDASIGSAFTIHEYVYKVTADEINTDLNVETVAAKVNGNTIATGSITAGDLNIAIPSVPDAYLALYGNQEPSFQVKPNTLKTGTLELSFMLGDQAFTLSKGAYSAIYKMLTKEIVYVYADKKASVTGHKEQTLDTYSTVMNDTMNVNFLAGWNIVDQIFEITVGDSSVTMNITGSSNIPSGYKWYLTTDD